MNLDKLHTLGDQLRRLEAEYRQVAEQARQHQAAAIRIRHELVADVDSAAARLLQRTPAELADTPTDELTKAGIPATLVQRILAAHRAAERAERERAELACRLAGARTLHERCTLFARKRGVIL